MARYLFGAVLLLATGFATAADPELHVVAVHDGHSELRERVAVKTAKVTVDRPGKDVILVVSAYHPVEWVVTATPKTNLTKVILGGYHRQSWKVPVGVEAEELSTECERQRILPLSLRADYKLDTPQSRRFVRASHKHTKLEIASFQGVYQFDPKKPLVVDAIQNDDRLGSDFPKLTPAAQVPRFKFQGTRLVTTKRGFDAAFGDFTEAGPKNGSFVHLPKGVLQVTSDPNTKKHYGITGHDLHAVNLGAGLSEKINCGLEKQPNWLRALTFDTKRDRVIISGRNALYEYTPKNGVWQVLIDNSKGSFSALVWQKATDTLYAIGKNERGRENREAPVLYELKVDGTVAKTTLLGAPMFPAVMDGGLYDRAELIDLGGDLAALIYRENRDTDTGKRGDPEAFLYVIDPKSGKVQLAWKE